MRKKWIFFALVPLFSYAAVPEEWLLESTCPVELQQKQLKNKEEISHQEDFYPISKAKQRRAQATPQHKRSDWARIDNGSPRSLKQPYAAQGKKTLPDLAHGPRRTSQWSAFLEDLLEEKQSKKTGKGLNIVTNRKPKQYPFAIEDQTHPDTLIHDESEISFEKSLDTRSLQSTGRTSQDSSASKYRYKAPEKIGAEGPPRKEERAHKRKNELLKKNNRPRS